MKPILFNTDMVRAILDGNKTVTRRIMKPQPIVNGSHTEWNGYEANLFRGTQDGFDKLLLARIIVDGKSPYRPGDILYVRETWTTLLGENIYKADQKPNMKNPGKWRPSIFMPREAARIFLRVTNVRVERLRDIDETGALDEGALPLFVGTQVQSARKDFQIIWDDTIKPADRERYGWAANPWVWEISFERIDKEEVSVP